MLIDDLLADSLRLFDQRKAAPFLARLRSAQKFQLAPEFAAVADEMRLDLDQIAKALPMARLPFARTWIEFAQAHRKPSAPHQAPLQEYQHDVDQIGFFLEATDDTMTRFVASQFWTLHDPDRPGIQIAVHQIPFDLNGVDGHIIAVQPEPIAKTWHRASDATRETLIRAILHPRVAEYGLPLAWIAYVGTDKAAWGRIADMSLKDWWGETAYIQALLALMNARNVTVTNFIDKTEHNKKRAKRGRLPLFSHHVLTIHPRQMARVRAARGDGSHAALRAHFVRGHWKVRKTGIFFWHPHARGSERRGEIDKTYKVA